jgi:hypothetical protein
MQVSNKRRAGLALATGATVVGLVAGGGPAAAQDYNVGTGPITIKMQNVKKRKVFFSGPKKISRGEKLTIKNVSNPQQIGPHTFTLIQPSKRPKGRKQFKACGNLQLPVCRKIGKAHKFDPKTKQINKPSVDVGKKGWDKSFGNKGDTWYTQAKGDKETRKVTAPVGTTLTYFCVIHPNMHGTLKVVK